MKTLITGFLPHIIAAAGTVLTGLVSWGAVWAKKYAATKTNNELVENALTRISHTVETVVSGLVHTLVISLTETTADGCLSADDVAKLKTDALENVKQLIPAAIRENAKNGITDLDAWTTKKIEQTLLKVLPPAFPVSLGSGKTGAADSGLTANSTGV